MKKKKILIRIGSLRHGGAEKTLVTFLKYIPSNKYEIDLLLNLYSGKYLSEVPDWINVYYLNKGEMITTNRIQDILPKAFRVIYQTFLKKYPTVLYNGKLNGKQYDIEFAAIQGMKDEILNSPITSSKKIVWIHNDLSSIKEYTPEKIKDFFRFDKIMVISDKIQSTFESIAKNETEKSKIVRIYNPIDTNEILDKSEKEIDNYTFNPNVPTFISIGTVFPQKGFDRLLNVHKKLLDEGCNHNILIVGDGKDFKEIDALKNNLGLQKTATMIGFTPNPYPYLKRANFFILSSRYEGFPTVLFEAITLKKKILATDVSGVKDMLLNGKLGKIMDNSEEGIYLSMKECLTNPNLFTKIEQNLKEYIAPFNLNTSVKKIEEIIDSL